jgi:hypothetical protein
MTISWPDSERAARFVEGLIQHSEPGSALTTTIIREKSGACSVQIVTGKLSADIEENSAEWNFYKGLLST